MVSIRLALCVVVLVVAAEAARVPRAKYTTRYDNIDLDEILKSERLLISYTNCMLEKGKCSPDGLELKNNLPDALTNDCAKCSEKQKDGSDKVIMYLINHKPEVWGELEKKYDPTGEYQKKYDERLKNLSDKANT